MLGGYLRPEQVKNVKRSRAGQSGRGVGWDASGAIVGILGRLLQAKERGGDREAGEAAAAAAR
jgi:hypothetical protein